MLISINFTAYILFPFKSPDGCRVDHHTPDREDADLLTAIAQVGAFKSYIPHGVIQLFQGQDLAGFA